MFGSLRLTYGQVNAAANQVAGVLASCGISPGDKVAISLPNIPHFTIAYFGVLKAGATVVPRNVLLRGRDIAYHLKDSEAKAYIAFEGTADLPVGQAAYEGFQAADGCQSLIIATADPRRTRRSGDRDLCRGGDRTGHQLRHSGYRP